jgi:hypothetical protein
VSHPNIISVGDDWYTWPPSLWGSRDRARAASMGLGQRELGTMPATTALTRQPSLPPISLYEKPSTRQERRSRVVDELVAKYRGGTPPSVRSVRRDTTKARHVIVEGDGQVLRRSLGNVLRVR